MTQMKLLKVVSNVSMMIAVQEREYLVCMYLYVIVPTFRYCYAPLCTFMYLYDIVLIFITFLTSKMCYFINLKQIFTAICTYNFPTPNVLFNILLMDLVDAVLFVFLFN